MVVEVLVVTVMLGLIIVMMTLALVTTTVEVIQ